MRRWAANRLRGRADERPDAERPDAERPDQEVDCYEPGFREKEAEKALRKAPEVPPNVEFVERVRQAAWAWHQLEQNKHGMLVRQYYSRR